MGAVAVLVSSLSPLLERVHRRPSLCGDPLRDDAVTEVVAVVGAEVVSVETDRGGNGPFVAARPVYAAERLDELVFVHCLNDWSLDGAFEEAKARRGSS